MTTRTRPATRLPAEPDPQRSRGAEILRGLLALVAIVVVVVGVPVALYAGFGTPWPDEAPSTDWVYSPISTRDVLGVLVAVVWLAWLHFVVCLLVELVADRRGRGLSPHVPGGSVGTQPLARRLVGAVLLLAGGVAVTMPAASAVTTAATARDASSRPDTVTVSTVAEPGGRLGHSRQPAEPDRADDGPAAFTKDTRRGVEKYVEVQPPHGRHYDTLWGIAERYLGDGMRYKEIAALNRGTMQPDGTTLQNPDLIYPGWILRLPADAEGPGLRTGDPQAARAGTGTPDRTTDRAGGDQQADSGADADLSAVQSSAADGSDARSGDESSTLAVGGFSAGGTLLAAGLLFALRRRRGWDGGPNPRGGKALDQEFDLRAAADESSAGFVDRALRSLPDHLADGVSLPAPSSVVLGSGALTVTFPPDSRMRLRSPWQGEPGGRTWTLARTDAIDLPAAPGALSPLPGLVALGAGGGAETLVDLESYRGIVSVSGDLDVARDVAVGMGLGLATSQWADTRRVIFVGFADDLSELAPDAIRHFDDLSGVFELLDGKRRRQHNACAAGGYDSVLTGRIAEPDDRLWAPDFVVVSGVPPQDDVDRLATLAADPRSAVGVVLVGDVATAPVRLVASSEGRLWCGPLGIDVSAHRVSAQTYRDALAVFDETAVRSTADTAATAVPVVDPDALAPHAQLAVRVTTMRGVQVEAPGEVDEQRRALLTEIVVYLALHPEGLHPNVLTAAIWPRGVSDEVRDSALAQAATWLGVDDQGTPRLTVDAEGRWQLGRSGVQVDWDVFRALANRAATGTEPTADLERALALAGAQPWSPLPAGRYGWLAYETIEADVRIAVVAVARRLAQLAAESGEPRRARDALMAGLRSVPACEPIWRDALRLAHRFGGQSDVVAVARDMYAALERFGSPLGAEPETDALVDELAPGFRRPAA